MTWTCAWRWLPSPTLCKFARGTIYAIDANQIGAQVRHDQIISSRVSEDVVRMRCVLATWNLARTAHCVLQRLEGLSTRQWQLEARDLACLTRRGQQRGGDAQWAVNELMCIGNERSLVRSSI